MNPRIVAVAGLIGLGTACTFEGEEGILRFGYVNELGLTSRGTLATGTHATLAVLDADVVEDENADVTVDRATSSDERVVLLGPPDGHRVPVETLSAGESTIEVETFLGTDRFTAEVADPVVHFEEGEEITEVALLLDVDATLPVNLRDVDGDTLIGRGLAGFTLEGVEGTIDWPDDRGLPFVNLTEPGTGTVGHPSADTTLTVQGVALEDVTVTAEILDGAFVFPDAGTEGTATAGEHGLFLLQGETATGLDVRGLNTGGPATTNDPAVCTLIEEVVLELRAFRLDFQGEGTCTVTWPYGSEAVTRTWAVGP